MPTITFLMASGTRKAISAPIGTSVMEAARQSGVPIPGTCGGSLACATCHVVVDPAQFDRVGPPTEEEETMLDLAFGVRPTSRLCCQIKVTEDLDGLVVALPGAAPSAA